MSKKKSNSVVDKATVKSLIVPAILNGLILTIVVFVIIYAGNGVIIESLLAYVKEVSLSEAIVCLGLPVMLIVAFITFMVEIGKRYVKAGK